MQTAPQILADALEAIARANDLKSLEQLRIQYLGKQSALSALLKSLGHVPPEDRRSLGQVVNTAKESIQLAFEEKRRLLEESGLQAHLQAGLQDMSLPGRGISLGGVHPVTQTLHQIVDWFVRLGFACITGPEIESDEYNFTKLNIPQAHPARAMHDTFYFDNEHLLRTHTSPVQIRVMESMAPPLQVVVPGRVYRCDSDLTHTPMFNQVEGFVVDKGIHFGHLKGILSAFLQDFFADSGLATRFRPAYFPFTEPSAEIDIACFNCAGKGCRICGHTGWLEVLGAGLIHPEVFRHCHVSEEYSGFAFGMGVERLTMLRYGITDLRMFFENDLRFLHQFNGRMASCS